MATVRLNMKEGAINTDRKRTNILRDIEQPLILFLCKHMPGWVTSDMLTAIGIAGSVITSVSFVLATGNRKYLLLAIAGFVVQWFGDSLDGRLAYFRNKPRKWYGFSLDMCVDWISTAIIAFGFYFYLTGWFKLLAFIIVVLYGWTMIMALLKYKVTGKYAIDISYVGPTEFRFVICLVLALETVFPGVFNYLALLVNIALTIACLVDFRNVLIAGNNLDRQEQLKRN